MSKEKDKRSTEPPKDDAHRQIIPRVDIDNEGMFHFLLELFDLSPRNEAPGETKAQPDRFPERIELCPVYGRGGKDRGRPIHVLEWKPMQSPVPTTEQVVMMANDFYGRAQTDCNGLKHPQRYGLFAFSTLKGHDYYSRHLIALEVTGRTYTEKDTPAVDDEDTHRDRLLSSALAHARWSQEHFAEAISGVLKLQQDIIRQQSDTIARQDSERRAWIITSEEALSRKQEREIAAERAKVWNDVIAEGVEQLKGLLPAVKIYLTKGKGGTILDSLRSFLDSLADEELVALFGDKDEAGNITKTGILRAEQITLFGSIVDGKEDVARLSEFMTSLEPDQLIAAQQAIRPVKIQELVGIVKSAADVINKSNGARA
jgi:hypothetical protein